LTQAFPGLRPSGALKRVQFRSRRNCVLAKVTKTVSPRQASAASRLPSPLGCLRGSAYGSRRLPWRSFLGDGGMAPKATLLIAAPCAHCRKRIRLGHWALHPCAGCGLAESFPRPFGSWLRLSSVFGSPTGREHHQGLAKEVLGPVWRARASQADGRAPARGEGRMPHVALRHRDVP
jgi:hypothetical protein